MSVAQTMRPSRPCGLARLEGSNCAEYFQLYGKGKMPAAADPISHGNRPKRDRNGSGQPEEKSDYVASGKLRKGL
jgi:hypothetical protein